MQRTCFKCKGVGVPHDPNMRKCSSNMCGKFYHLACLKAMPLTRMDGDKIYCPVSSLCPWQAIAGSWCVDPPHLCVCFTATFMQGLQRLWPLPQLRALQSLSISIPHQMRAPDVRVPALAVILCPM